MNNHTIALIGLSGSGKSSVGRELAIQLGWQFVDTDALIELNTGHSIPTIFAHAGEEQFREYETAALHQALAEPNRVIATGAGAILRPLNRALLGEHAFVVWLDAPTAILVERLQAHDEQRPLLAHADMQQRLDSLRSLRAALYSEAANLAISTNSLTHGQVVAHIRAATQL